MVARTIGFRIFRPADAPNWLPPVLDSAENLFRSEMPGPFKLWGVATADLPPAGNFGPNKTNAQTLVYDLTTKFINYSNGTIWIPLQAYSADLAALAALSGTGIVTRTGASTYTVRTITGTPNQVTVTNGNGVSGNPTLSTPASFIPPGAVTTLPDVSTILTLGRFGNVLTDSYIDASNAASQVSLGFRFRVDTAGTLTDRFYVSANGAQVFGGLRLPTRSISATASALLTDYTIRCDATSGAVTVNLPTAASSVGLVLNIKKIDATANAVTIDPNGAELIDGAATKATTTQYVSFNIQSNGTGWDLI